MQPGMNSLYNTNTHTDAFQLWKLTMKRKNGASNETGQRRGFISYLQNLNIFNYLQLT